LSERKLILGTNPMRKSCENYNFRRLAIVLFSVYTKIGHQIRQYLLQIPVLGFLMKEPPSLDETGSFTFYENLTNDEI
jgi:hypothetical protein